jgi:flagellar basal body-associated protein FliL
MNPEQTQATAETKSGSIKAIVAIIVIAALAGGAYYFSMSKAPTDSETSSEQLPTLSESDDTSSIEADLQSATFTDEDFSSFDAELNAR